MFRPRVIPVLLLKDKGLVKSRKFDNHLYIGDPINAVKIFNEKEVDELVILDISATASKRGPDFKKIADLTSEAFMPLGYGGGISKMEEVKLLISIGVEKVILNSIALEDPSFVHKAAGYVGSQSIVVSIDVKRNIWGKYKVYAGNGSKNTNLDPISFAMAMEAAGAGEILLNSIDRDGTFGGYDEDLIKMVSSSISIPLVAVGGASSVDDFKKAIHAGASAVAAGSMFVFQRPHRAVLISYPSQEELKNEVYLGL